jgi:hypothetical protein
VGYVCQNEEWHESSYTSTLRFDDNLNTGFWGRRDLTAKAQGEYSCSAHQPQFKKSGELSAGATACCRITQPSNGGLIVAQHREKSISLDQSREQLRKGLQHRQDCGFVHGWTDEEELTGCR